MKADRTTEAAETVGRDWSGFEIAVVGMAGRFPGAGSVERLWENLRDGIESISFFDRHELERAGVEPELLDDPAYVPAAGVLEGVDRFDAGFFGIPPREAALTDPQHRLFLEEAYHALEHAGRAGDGFAGRVGVYGGAAASAYLIRNLLASPDAQTRHGLPTTFGTQADFLTTRVSYKLGLRGPSIDVQTSCSTSLVAVHLACQALLAGECDLALAGGVCLDLPAKHGYLYREQGIYSPDGHCRAFDASAQGTVGGSGVAVVALRRLADAIESGDAIHGVIRGSAINNDGSEKVGYAAPSVVGQAAAIRDALAAAGVSAESVSYVEAHGTGTELGDEIEIAALTRAFREHTDRTGFCRIGSIKTNIGHLDTAAGVTGLIKVCLALAHGEIPASLHYREPHPRLALASTPFMVADRLSPWQGPRPLRAGVSSFGIGGTNVHLVVEEPPARTTAAPRRRRQLLVTSAKSVAALERVNSDLARYLERHEPELADVAFTLQTGRDAHPHRGFAVAGDREEAARALETGGERERSAAAVDDRDRPVVFLFPGQGSQYVGMGRGLYDEEPEFRRVLDRCAEILEPELGSDLRSILYPEPGDEEAAAERLRRTAVAQPAIFAVDYAVARMAMASGVEPVAMAGHSLGEYVAACLAEVVSLEQALGLVAERGRLMQKAPTGSMLAVALASSAVEEALPDDLTIAVVNGPEQVVVSGPTEAIERFARELGRRGATCRRLATSHAFHSPMMDGVIESFTAAVERCRLEAPRRPYLSCLTGTWITPEQASDPVYYARQMREPVRFATVVEELLDDPRRILLEAGPGRVLTAIVTRAVRGGDGGEEPRAVAIAAMRAAGESRDDGAAWLEAVGRLWQAGGRVEWSRGWAGERRGRVPLPLYPFAGERHWIEPPTSPRSDRRREEVAGKIADPSHWFYAPSFRRASIPPVQEIDPGGSCLLLADHGVAAGLARELEAAGVETIVVRAGDRAPHPDDRELTVRPGVEGDYDRLLEIVAERGGPPAWVACLWSLDVDAEPELGSDLTRTVERVFLAPVLLARALERAAVSPPRFLAVTRGVHAVIGAEASSPAQGLVQGAVLAISQEAPLSARAVDLDPAADAAEGAEHLVAELASTASERFVAYRGGHRWVRGAEPMPLAEPVGRPRLLAESGHYLIVGGTGAVGLEVAHFLAEAVGARLTLTGRREVPDWHRAEATSDDELASRAAAELRRIEALGGEVATVVADATDPTAMRRVMERAEEERGPIRGVVFTPGAPKEMWPLAALDADACLAQLRPKMEGLATLDEVLADRPLDFCLVHSSLASRLGALALAPYVAAHSFVEAYVDWHNASGRRPWSVVAWDNWLSWKEPEIRLSESEAGFFMQPSEARRALARVLDLPAGAALLVSTGDLDRRLARWVDGGDGEIAVVPRRGERPEASQGSAAIAGAESVEDGLARIFSEVLGVEDVRVDDSFFELGGDSVLGLQVVSRAAAAGWRISPAALFDNPTPAALAAAAVAGPGSARSAARPEGEVPLTPIQRWFFERRIPHRDHFNLPVVVELPTVPEPSDLRRALDAVVAQHDAFRLRYESTGGEIRQRYAAEIEVPLDRFSSGDPEAIEERLGRLQRSLDLAEGPVAAALLLERGPSEPAQLVWTAHHLVIDLISWRVLVEDLETALAQLGRGEPVALPPKTTSFGAWAEAAHEFARSAAVRAQRDYWLEVATAEVDPLPVDATDGDDDVGSAASVEVRLEEETASELLAGAPALGLGTDHLLLAVVADSIADWTGTGRVRIEVEGHGREAIAPGLDLSRTVGWFTALYPVLLDLPETADAEARLLAVRRQLERVPGRGLGYGALRYLGEDRQVRRRLAEAEDPQVAFLYLGRSSDGRAGEARILPLATAGPAAHPATPRRHLLEVVAVATNEDLRLEIAYGRNRHRTATIEAWAEGVRSRLDEAARIARRSRRDRAVADEYPATRLRADDLERLLARIGDGADGSTE